MLVEAEEVLALVELCWEASSIASMRESRVKDYFERWTRGLKSVHLRRIAPARSWHAIL